MHSAEEELRLRVCHCVRLRCTRALGQLACVKGNAQLSDIWGPGRRKAAMDAGTARRGRARGAVPKDV